MLRVPWEKAHSATAWNGQSQIVRLGALRRQECRPRGPASPSRQPWAEEASATVIRMTRELSLTRLLAQIERILEVNGLPKITKAVAETARETLVIGEA